MYNDLRVTRLFGEEPVYDSTGEYAPVLGIAAEPGDVDQMWDWIMAHVDGNGDVHGLPFKVRAEGHDGDDACSATLSIDCPLGEVAIARNGSHGLMAWLDRPNEAVVANRRAFSDGKPNRVNDLNAVMFGITPLIAPNTYGRSLEAMRKENA